MDAPLDVLITHRIPGGEHRMPGSGVSELRESIESRLPDLDIAIAETPADSLSLVPTANVVLTQGLTTELLDAADELRWVQALSAGVESYDRDRLHEEGIVLTNASGVHAEPIAEQVLGYVLAFERRIHRGIRQAERRTWEWYWGGEVRGKTLGVIGLGSIGGRVAELASLLGMDVVATKRNPETDTGAADEVLGPDGTAAVLARADYAVLACPLTEDTRNLVDRDALVAMNDSGVLINVARGGIVHQDSLVTALQQGWIRGAALDAFAEEPLPRDSPLWDLSNVILTPHMAGATPRYWERTADVFAENYRQFVDGTPDEMPTRVD